MTALCLALLCFFTIGRRFKDGDAKRTADVNRWHRREALVQRTMLLFDVLYFDETAAEFLNCQ